MRGGGGCRGRQARGCWSWRFLPSRCLCVSLRGTGAAQQWPHTEPGSPRMRKLFLVLIAAAAALFGPALRADDFPSKPITLVAVFGPGSASDTICRVIAEPLGVALKQTV